VGSSDSCRSRCGRPRRARRCRRPAGRRPAAPARRAEHGSHRGLVHQQDVGQRPHAVHELQAGRGRERRAELGQQRGQVSRGRHDRQVALADVPVDVGVPAGARAVGEAGDPGQEALVAAVLRQGYPRLGQAHEAVAGGLQPVASGRVRLSDRHLTAGTASRASATACSWDIARPSAHAAAKAASLRAARPAPGRRRLWPP
jgi:hypothetical protein